MKVRMKLAVSGYRNDAKWPAVGGEIVVPDAEGKDLCAQGYADPVAEPVKAEQRPAARKSEKR